MHDRTVLTSIVGEASHVVLRVITGWVQSPVKNSCSTMGYGLSDVESVTTGTADCGKDAD